MGATVHMNFNFPIKLGPKPGLHITHDAGCVLFTFVIIHYFLLTARMVRMVAVSFYS